MRLWSDIIVPSTAPNTTALMLASPTPLQRDHAAMHVGLQGVIAAEARHPGEVELAALLEILQRAAADRQPLRRTGLGVAVEQPRDIAHARRRGQQIAVAHV